MGQERGLIAAWTSAHPNMSPPKTSPITFAPRWTERVTPATKSASRSSRDCTPASKASSPSPISKAASGRADRQRLPLVVSRSQRLDLELVRRGLVRSRAEAQRLIDEGKVKVNGMPLAGAASLVGIDSAITLTEARRFVSRGGDKLDGALDRLQLDVAGRRWLDAGASTGGFTDRLLQGGATGVAAIDVGYGQLDWGLRNDPRVTVLERQNIRSLES